MIRWLTMGLVTLLAIGAVTFDRLSPIDLSRGELTVAREINPSLSVDPKLNGSWFCPSGTSNVDGLADHEIVIVNLSAASAVANISVVTDVGPSPELQLPLAPFGSETIRLADLDLIDSVSAGAVVEIIGGEGIVGHTVQTAEGIARGTCASQVSDTWYFANGRTTEDTKLYLTLLNPFKDTAVYDVELQIAGRPIALQREDLQGQALQPNSVVRLDIGESVPTPEENVTVKVTTRRGQVVAERLQIVDGSAGPAGASLQLGVPEGANSWIFPAGRLHADGGDQIVVWNPSEDETTTVEVGFWPVDPEDRSTFSFTAIERELQPGRFEVIDLLTEGASFGIDLPYELGVTVSSPEGPVVAERWHLGKGYNPIEPAEEPPAEEEGEEAEEGDEEETPEEEAPALDASGFAQPTASDGIATSRGVEVVSERWVVPWADVIGSQLVVTSAEAASLKIEIQAGGQLLAEPILESVDARGRVVIDFSVDPTISAISPNGTVTLTADSNVAAEIQIVDESGAIDIVPAIPTV